MYFLRVNMSDRSYEVTEMPAEYKYLAGRALTFKYHC